MEDQAAADEKNPSRLLNDNTSISSLPEEILLHILSFVPADLAIRTSALSKRWEHLWSVTRSLSFDRNRDYPEKINKTLENYVSTSKIKSFHLCSKLDNHVISWIGFAMSKNVEKLSLKTYDLTDHYSFPDFFYNNAYLKQLAVEVESRTIDLIPRCKVSWTSLRDLSLTYCKLSDDSFPKILSGCPMLESLTLRFVDSLKYLDLSEYKRLRRLDVDFKSSFTGPMEIVAPHIYYLRLRNFKAQCSLVDVSSLTEANLNAWYYSRDTEIDSLQVTVQSMLEKLYNVEELTLGVNFIQILSLAQLRGVHFPQFKIKILNLETRLSRSVVPGTVKILQSSTGLKKIVINITKWGSILEGLVDGYLASQELSLDQWWRSKLVAFPTYTSKRNPELVASLMELLLANTETLETLVVHYGSGFENLLEIARKLSHNSKVSVIVLK